jgi:hypothetical protein
MPNVRCTVAVAFFGDRFVVLSVAPNLEEVVKKFHEYLECESQEVRDLQNRATGVFYQLCENPRANILSKQCDIIE